MICIDDNSADGSADMVAEEFPEVILIRNTVNQSMPEEQNQVCAVRGRVTLACWTATPC